MSRKTVHKHTKSLLKAGHVVLMNKGGNPLLYGPGPVPFPRGNNPPSGMVKGGNKDLTVHLHHVKLYFPVISKPTVDLDSLNWDRVWKGTHNDVHYKKMYKRGNAPVDMTPIKSIVYHRGKNNETLQVNLEGFKVPLKDYNVAAASRWAKAQDMANDFAKKYHVMFGLPREPEDRHGALPPPPGLSEEVMRRAKEMNFRTDYVSVEASDGPLEFELQDLDILNAYGNLPKILDGLAEADESTRSHLIRQAQKANITIQNITKITGILRGHQEQINMLLKLLATQAVEDAPMPKEEMPSEGRYIG